MDDYSVNSLVESKNEWCARLVSILTPAIIVGLKSIFDEAIKLCEDNDEEDKYLMTFQTFLTRVPKWNNEIIEIEKNRIVEESNCHYLEDLITCVHIVHLKALSCIRVGQEQKKIDIDIPSVDKFVHKIYIEVARKIYTNVYLFEKDIPPLNIQKHNRELELLIKESILSSIRDNMPVESLLRAYISETNEEEVDIKEEIVRDEIKENKEEENKEVKDTKKDEDIKEKKVEEKLDKKEEVSNEDKKEEKIENLVINTEKMDELSSQSQNEVKKEEKEIKAPDKLEFNDTDYTISTEGEKKEEIAPKNIERLEKISVEANEKRKQEEAEEEGDDSPLKIGDEVRLEIGSINDLSKPIDIKPMPEIEVETLI